MIDVKVILDWIEQHVLILEMGAGIFLVLMLLVIFFRRRKQAVTQEDDLYGDRYFDETPEEHAFQGKPKKESRRIEREATPPARTPSEEPLIIALFLTAKQPCGFSGSDIFSVLEELGCEYGKHQIFHHFGVGEPKAKQAVFSIANMLEPGTFNPDQQEQFVTEGLAIFMQLPGVFGGRVAFELMLNTTQRMADKLEGQVCNERRQVLEPTIIQNLRDKIAKFEQRE